MSCMHWMADPLESMYSWLATIAAATHCKYHAGKEKHEEKNNFDIYKALKILLLNKSVIQIK